MARPTAAELASLAPDAPPELIEGHLHRLSASYYRSFALPAIARHVQGLSHLSRLHPAEVQVEVLAGDQVSCTFLAFDAPSLLSLLAGVLASLGFNVHSGDAYTYRPVEAAGSGVGRSWHRHLDGSLWRQRIVDRVTGQVAGGTPLAAWSTELAQRVETVAGMVQRDELDAARRTVNEWVVDRLAADDAASPPSPFETEVRIRAASTGKFRLEVLSEDTPAFLYSLSTALALQNTTIDAVRIRTRGHRVHDRLTLGPAQPADSGAAEQRLRLSVLLTKQFTYFLGSAADPYAALARFDWLTRHVLAGRDQTRWLEVLSDPRGMTLLARLLGASDFLWDDFIRPRVDDVLAALQRHLPRAASAAAEPALDPPGFNAAEAATAGGEQPSVEHQLATINQRKDGASFVAELDYILGGSADVEGLSRGLTRIAEAAISAVAGALYADLTTAEKAGSSGQGDMPAHAIFGLGKFGAQALGYASDLELLLVYGGEGKAAGPIGARRAAFFGTLVRRLEESITAKQQGLFQLDLRLRPYGRNAALECSWQTFQDYYGQTGEAHSLERLALTRLRGVAGDTAFGRQVEHLRDELVYQQAWLRMDELGEVRRQQFQEKAAGTRNAKYSAGALVDCEYVVQVLQVRHGARHESVRSPEIGAAVRSLAAVGVLSSGEADSLLAAYLFFRRLINSLRMLRGLAEDLVLPEPASAEALHLARRMGWATSATTPAAGLEAAFERHRDDVRACVERYAPELSVSS